jgi:hypothetical protein
MLYTMVELIYILKHKGKKIILLPLTLAEMKDDKELAEISKNDHALDSPTCFS